MMRVSLPQLAEVVGAQVVPDKARCQIERVSTDTRTLGEGALFVALVGERFDGHDFIAQAEQAGASALLVSRPVESTLPQLRVQDTLLALGQLGAYWRQQVNPYCVALTGSVGKTSVKEMTASIFALAGETLATRGNLNNTIGVPLTLLELTPAHRYAVIEMGANHQGEIRYTSSLVQPDVAMINNIQPAHLEGFGGIEGVAKAKCEIFEYLADDGKAVVNLDDDHCEKVLATVAERDVIRFSSRQVADIWADNVTRDPLSGSYHFLLHRGEASVPVQLPVPGRHQVDNALAAAALASAADLSLDLIAEGLRATPQVPGRTQFYRLSATLTVVDDSYNANLASTKAALDLLSEQAGQTLLVFGDMGELGEDAESHHRLVGEYAAEKGIDYLLTVGTLSAFATETFAGAEHFSGHGELIARLESLVSQTDAPLTVLIKGSRSARMEQIVSALRERFWEST
ncbi:UDP-N-acetylmuramoyl-tripeptide--D-alanyl-D-alanine ligase [Ferrimonas gelatinilytica]|uniref:UDP-N-acetylmuramoyl-tripeptide--D-alanyl-D-alanine ligase n=1 Tax=Ferrimonas gelatinilytica TaxID=1255257 RepID=A0ABP9SCY4_9GAMM